MKKILILIITALAITFPMAVNAQCFTGQLTSVTVNSGGNVWMFWPGHGGFVTFTDNEAARSRMFNVAMSAFLSNLVVMIHGNGCNTANVAITEIQIRR